MGYKFSFMVGFAAGFMAGSRAGRERYDQIVSYGQQVAAHPQVQKATNTVTAKATELGKTAAAKAPDLAKTAATTVSQQVPKMASTAKQKASGRLPFGGKSDTGDEPLVYPSDSQSSVNGVRYTPD